MPTVEQQIFSDLLDVLPGVDVAPENTAWGLATRVAAPFAIDGVTLGGRGAHALGADAPEWL